MPEKQHGEKLSSFVKRYVSSKRAKKDFPSIKQRLAVAYSEGGEGKKKRA
jgi:hypothetical protein